MTVFRISAFVPSSTLFASAFVALGFSLSGCDSDLAPEVTREDFCERWATAACSDEVVSVCQASSAVDCRQAQRGQCLDDLPDDFVDRGVDKCIDAVKKAYDDADLTAEELEVVARYGAPCDAIFLSSEGGERCEDDSDCEPALRCILKEEDEGTCEVPVIVDAGFSCSAPDEMCEEGFFCDGRNCLAALEEGESCNNHLQCGTDMYCDGVCFEKDRVGDDCASDAECLSGICYDDEGDRTCVDRLRLSPAEPMCDSLR